MLRKSLLLVCLCQRLFSGSWKGSAAAIKVGDGARAVVIACSSDGQSRAADACCANGSSRLLLMCVVRLRRLTHSVRYVVVLYCYCQLHPWKRDGGCPLIPASFRGTFVVHVPDQHLRQIGLTILQ
jgi:hypothetical protein